MTEDVDSRLAYVRSGRTSLVGRAALVYADASHARKLQLVGDETGAAAFARYLDQRDRLLVTIDGSRASHGSWGSGDRRRRGSGNSAYRLRAAAKQWIGFVFSVRFRM